MNSQTLIMKNLFQTVGEALSTLVSQDGSPKMNKKQPQVDIARTVVVGIHKAMLAVGKVDLPTQVVEALENKKFVKELLYLEATNIADIIAEEKIISACTECGILPEAGLKAYNLMDNYSTIQDAIQMARTAIVGEVYGQVIDEAVIDSIRTVMYASNRIRLPARPTGKEEVSHHNLHIMVALLDKAHKSDPCLRSSVMRSNVDILATFGIDMARSNAYNVATKKIRRLILREWYNTGFFPQSSVERSHLCRYIDTAFRNVIREGDPLWNDAGYVMYALDSMVRMSGFLTECSSVDRNIKSNLLIRATYASKSFDILRHKGVSPSIILFNRYGRNHTFIDLAAKISFECLRTVKAIDEGSIHYSDDGTLIAGSEFGAMGIVHNDGKSTVHTGQFHTGGSRTLGTLFENETEPEAETVSEGVTFTSLFEGKDK